MSRIAEVSTAAAAIAATPAGEPTRGSSGAVAVSAAPTKYRPAALMTAARASL
jgi:hypothetical protein